MIKKNKNFFVKLIFLILFFYSIDSFVLAQYTIPPLRLIKIDQIQSHSIIKIWKLKNQEGEKITITQTAVPIMFGLLCGNRASFSIRSIYAYSNTNPYNTTTSDYRLKSWSDVKLDGSIIIGEQYGLLTFGMNIPSGKEKLTKDELTLATTLAEDVFDFPLSLHGAGREYHVGLFLAKNWNWLTCGGGVSYYWRKKFQILDQLSGSWLDPGDEGTLSFGADFELPYGKINVDTYYTLRDEDKFFDEGFYDPGEKIVLNIQSHFRYPRGLPPIDISFWVRNRWKRNNCCLQPSQEILNIIRPGLNENPHQLEVGTNIKYLLGFHTHLMGDVDYKYFSENKLGFKNADVTGVGIGLNLDGYSVGVIDWITINLMAKYYFGHFNNLGFNYDVTGYHIFINLKCTF